MGFKSVARALTAAAVDAFAVPATQQASVHGLVLGNPTGQSVAPTVRIHKHADGVSIDLPVVAIEPGATWTFPKPINMEAGDRIAIAGLGLTALLSIYQDDGATIAAKGFTPRGAWSASATYASNDVVTDAETKQSYVSLADANTGHAVTDPAWWMVFFAGGATGSGLNVGDILVTAADPGEGWLPADGSVFQIAAYPELAPLLAPKTIEPARASILPMGAPTTTFLFAAWSPNGRYLAYVSNGPGPTLCVFDFQTGSPVKLNDPSALPPFGTSLSWSPDSRIIAVTRQGPGFFDLYQIENNTISKMENPSSPPPQITNKSAWSPDGRYLVVTFITGAGHIIYDWQSGVPVKMPELPGLPNPVGCNAVAWSPDGRYLLIMPTSQFFYAIYEWNSGNPVRVNDWNIDIPFAAQGATWSPDGKYISIAHIGFPFVSIFEMVAGRPVRRDVDLPPPAQGVFPSWSSDSAYMAVCHSLAPFISIYRPDGDIFRRTPDVIPASSQCNCVAWAGDAREGFAVAGGVPANAALYASYSYDPETQFQTPFVPSINKLLNFIKAED